MKYVLNVLMVIALLTATFVSPLFTAANEGSPMTKVVVHIDQALQAKGWRYLQVFSPRCASDPNGCLPSELARIPFENGVASYHMGYDFVATFYLQKEWRAEFQLAGIVGSLDEFWNIPSMADLYVYTDCRYESYKDRAIIVLTRPDVDIFLGEVYQLGTGTSTEDAFKNALREYVFENLRTTIYYGR